MAFINGSSKELSSPFTGAWSALEAEDAFSGVTRSLTERLCGAGAGSLLVSVAAVWEK